MSESPSTTVTGLDELTEVLPEFQRVLQRIGYQRVFLDRLGRNVDLGTIRVLRAIERRGDQATSVQDVARVLAVDASTASRLVDRCVGKQLVARRVSDDDRRRAELSLAPAGSELLSRATATRRDILADATRDWTPSDVAALAHLMRSLLIRFREFDDQ